MTQKQPFGDDDALWQQSATYRQAFKPKEAVLLGIGDVIV